MKWYLDKTYYIKTLSGECCSTTELMGKEIIGTGWMYALVMYHEGQVTLKAIFLNGTEINE